VVFTSDKSIKTRKTKRLFLLVISSPGINAALAESQEKQLVMRGLFLAMTVKEETVCLISMFILVSLLSSLAFVCAGAA